MATWLAKTEPTTYSWQKLVKQKRTRWDGVRNAQARINLLAMKVGEQVLIYHSGEDKAVFGIAKVAKSAYRDPSADDPRWVCVDLAAEKELPSPVSLAKIKAEPALKNCLLVKNSRLSVMPLSADELRAILALASGG
jgi:predicted RNA-binding protein with PUA-like domain